MVSLQTVLCDQFKLLYASWLAHLLPVLTLYSKKGFREEENVSGSREQKKLQRTRNSGWLVGAANLDCSHLIAADCCHRNSTCNACNARLAPQCCAFV